MKYQVTKIQCQKNINKANMVCDRCGRAIVPIKTRDNSGNPTYWGGCFHGGTEGNFTYGVPKKTYELAYKLVLEDNLDLGMKKGKGYDFDYLFQNVVANVASILRQIEYIKTHKPRKTKTELRKEFNKFYKK